MGTNPTHPPPQAVTLLTYLPTIPPVGLLVRPLGISRLAAFEILEGLRVTDIQMLELFNDPLVLMIEILVNPEVQGLRTLICISICAQEGRPHILLQVADEHEDHG